MIMSRQYVTLTTKLVIFCVFHYVTEKNAGNIPKKRLSIRLVNRFSK